jgi:hypothetical protein
MNEKRQLLCTFSTLKSYKESVEEIRKFYVIYSDRFFVFSNLNNVEEVFVTYNIVNDNKNFPKFKNTISIHRKKQTNTLYTLNAMNQIIKDENGGVFDKTFSVDWSLYQNSLVITGEPMIRVIPIKMLEIIIN